MPKSKRCQVAATLKTIHAEESLNASMEKVVDTEKLEGMRLAVGGTFPDRRNALMLATTRLKYVADSK